MRLKKSAQTDDPFDVLNARAEQGDRSAQFDLALTFVKRRAADRGSIAPNYQEALKWFTEAALRGHMRAQFNLAYLYSTGLWASNFDSRKPGLDLKEQVERRNNAVKNGKAEAIKWLHIATENGHAGAQYVLGQMYRTRAHGLTEPRKDGASVLIPPAMNEKGKLELTAAVKWFQKAAEAGHAGAQCSLGSIYGGVDVNGFLATLPDPIASAKWRRKAADQGVASEQTKLGDMRAAGIGVSQNLAEAARWYRAAAEQGSEEAQERLGYMYAVGDGVPRDFGEAANLFRMAAERYRWLMDGERPFEGSDPRTSNFWHAVEAESVSWFCDSAEKGWALAQTAVERMGEEAARRDREDSRRRSPGYSFGFGVLRDVPEMMEAFREAAQQGDAKAQLALGLIWLSSAEAPEWLQKAARQGVALAARLLAGMYQEGENVSPPTGVPRDADQAEIYYRAAAELGDAIAQYEVGRLLLRYAPTPLGRDFSPNWDATFKHSCDSSGRIVTYELEAADWYSKAAEQGHAQAQSQLAILYFVGQGVPKDWTVAATWFRKAAEQGYANAQYELAEMYSNGAGVPKDRNEAARWHRKAAEQGHKLARDALGGFDFDGDPLSQNGAEIAEWIVSANSDTA